MTVVASAESPAAAWVMATLLASRARPAPCVRRRAARRSTRYAWLEAALPGAAATPRRWRSIFPAPSLSAVPGGGDLPGWCALRETCGGECTVVGHGSRVER